MGKSTWLRVVLLGASVVGWLIALSGCLPDTVSPDFVLAFSPAEVTVTTGSAATTVVSVVRTGGFASPVELVFLGMPAGVSVIFAPNPVPGSRSTVTVTTTQSVIPGIYTLVLRGTGDGLVRTAHLTLNVVAAGPSGRVLFFDSFEGGRADPAWAFNTQNWTVYYGRLYNQSIYSAQNDKGFVTTGPGWGPYNVEFDLDLAGVFGIVGVVFYASEDRRDMAVVWMCKYQDQIWLQVIAGGQEVATSRPVSPGPFVGPQKVRIDSDGTSYRVFLRDLLCGTFQDSTYTRGMPGIIGGGGIYIDNYKVTSRE